METENKSNDGALTVLINESGIDLTEAETIKQSYLPFFEQMAQVKEAAKKIDFVNPTELDETIARELRLKTVKIRTGSEALKDERKRGHMLKGNLEQSAWNLIRDSCKLDEDTFINVEKAREIKAKQEKENRKQDRLAALMPYGVDTQFIDLLNMDDESFQMTLANSKLAYDTKIELERKAEEARLEKERIDILHKNRKESVLNTWQFFPTDFKHENFGELANDQWNALVTTMNENKAEFEKEQDEIRRQNEILKKQTEAKEKELAEEKEKAAKLKEIADFNLKEQQKANQKLQDELKAKALAEKQKNDALLQAADDKIKAEKLAKEAPDKEKLKLLVVQIGAIKLPDVQSEFAILIIEELSLQIDQIILSLNQSINQIK